MFEVYLNKLLRKNKTQSEKIILKLNLNDRKIIKRRRVQMTRKPSLNTTISKKICDEIKRGLPITKAPLLAGVTAQTFYNWYNRGKKAKKGKFHDFYNEVEEAKAYAIALRVENIRQAGVEGNWQADAWWLERVDPENFGRRDKLSLNGDLRHEHKNVKELFSEELIDEIINEE